MIEKTNFKKVKSVARISAKPPFFSVFKSVNLVGKSDDALTARRRRARKSQGVVVYSQAK